MLSSSSSWCVYEQNWRETMNFRSTFVSIIGIFIQIHERVLCEVLRCRKLQFYTVCFAVASNHGNEIYRMALKPKYTPNVSFYLYTSSSSYKPYRMQLSYHFFTSYFHFSSLLLLLPLLHFFQHLENIYICAYSFDGQIKRKTNFRIG